MSCPIISGHTTLDCLDGVGGIETIYITEVENLNTFTVTAGTVTAMTLDTGKQFWAYVVDKEDAMFEETGTTDPVKGTSSYAQTGTWNIRKQSATKRNQIRLLQQNRLMVITKDNNGLYKLYGKTGGFLTTAVDSSGKLFGDANGYALTFDSN